MEEEIKKEEAKKEEIGKITHYFSHVGAGVIGLSAPLKVGDTIQIKGHTTDFTQKVDSMQIERESVQEGKKGDAVGVKMKDRVRQGDIVYKIS
ncbi:translation elongation factor-like protein [bacterium]|nr:translation elongation factor-like protein [bacterium]MCK4325915.1 translation elongation factor-like protein [bacterium]MCK4437378.1 translation elongation factor-like protein [bacterium]